MSLQWVPTANAFELATEYGLIKFAEDLVHDLSACSRVLAHIFEQLNAPLAESETRASDLDDASHASSPVVANGDRPVAPTSSEVVVRVT